MESRVEITGIIASFFAKLDYNIVSSTINGDTATVQRRSPIRILRPS
ncbi:MULTISPECIES: hypothetical protein [unclassified Dehalobacter]|nr:MULTISPECIES: hypothetical protein [unclassified Dehalobacter]